MRYVSSIRGGIIGLTLATCGCAANVVYRPLRPGPAAIEPAETPFAGPLLVTDFDARGFENVGVANNIDIRMDCSALGPSLADAVVAQVQAARIFEEAGRSPPAKVALSGRILALTFTNNWGASTSGSLRVEATLRPLEGGNVLWTETFLREKQDSERVHGGGLENLANDLRDLVATDIVERLRRTPLPMVLGRTVEAPGAVKPPAETPPTREPEPAKTPGPAPRTDVEVSGDTFVLAIGINDYDDPHIPKLRFAEQDARAVYGFFATSRKSPTSRDRVVLLTGKDATRSQILRTMREHLERKATRAEDMVVLYFAGHGFSDADDTYLAPVDTHLDSLRESGLPSSTLRDYWSKIRAGRKILIMDACHAGGIENMRGTRGVSGVKIGDDSAQPAAATTTLVIAATGPNELSTEDPDLGQGVFTRALLNGLNGDADENKDGRISGDELGRYLVREVPGIARSFGGNQTPVITQSSKGGPAIVLTR